MNEISTLSRKLQLIKDEGLIFKLYSITFKNPTTFTLLYWLCPGFALIDRFFIGSSILGLLKIFMPIIIVVIYLLNYSEVDVNTGPALTVLGFGFYFLWILIDGFTVSARVKNYNMDKIYGITDFNTQPQQTDSEWECIHCGYRQADSFLYCPKCKLDDDGLLRKS